MRHNTIKFVAIGVIALTAVCVLLALQPLTHAQEQLVARPICCADGRIAIRSLPYVVASCGSYYVAGCLQGVAGGHGIRIQSDDVTIDLNGFTLTGGEGSGDGIRAEGTLRNLRVFNGAVVGWDGAGVELSSAGAVLLHDVTARTNGGDGIKIGADSIVERAVAIANGGNGVSVGARSLTSSCIARQNVFDGIVCDSHSMLRDSIASQNGRNGIAAMGVDGWVERNVTVLHAAPLAAGVFVDAESTVVINNHVIQNTIDISMGPRHDIGPYGEAATATSPFTNFRDN